MTTKMTPAEIDVFLDSQRTLVLVTLRPDGSPVAHPMWFVRLGDALYLNTRRDSLKSRNAAREGRVCAVVEAGETYFELRGVRIEGRCEEVKESVSANVHPAGTTGVAGSRAEGVHRCERKISSW